MPELALALLITPFGKKTTYEQIDTIKVIFTDTFRQLLGERMVYEKETIESCLKTSFLYV